MSTDRIVHVEQPLYGGSSLTSEPGLTLPFVLRGESVEVSADSRLVRIVEPASQRIAPHCPHFGACGGCQYQMTIYEEQLATKHEILLTQLRDAGLQLPKNVGVHSGKPYGYRNRIRLRAERADGKLRFGYNVRTTTEFLPITTCPISAPILWETAEILLSVAEQHEDVAFWLNAASEVELFCSDDLSRIQMTLLCAPRTKVKQGSLERCFAALQKASSQIVGVGAIASDLRTGPTGRTLAAVGAAGLNYRVLDETYWISRGGFFQVNRFLLETLVKLVCEENGQARNGTLAWDLYAGVGLFSRVLAKTFEQVIAVEASATAAADNRTAMRKLGSTRDVVNATTLDFLRSAVLQRERPELIVLDPPRAGAGVEVCELLLRIAPPQMVYVSCDPTTLARDLQILIAEYRIARLDLVDLFPQTFHMETIVVLERKK
jgi:23S rRNA (uracil1939-C5)-methyltransferase